MSKAEEFFVFLVRSIDGITVSVGNFTRIRLIYKRCAMRATLGDSFCDRVK